MLSVIAVDVGYHKDVVGVSNPQSVNMVERSLVDGGGERIHARLAISLAEVGRMLRRGDRLFLDLHTELRYRVSKNHPRMTALMIYKLSRVGNYPLLDEDVKLQRMMT